MRHSTLPAVILLSSLFCLTTLPAQAPADYKSNPKFTAAMAEGKQFSHKQQYIFAIDAYKKAVAIEPDGFEPRLHAVIAESLAVAGRWKEAKGPFERFAALDPGVTLAAPLLVAFADDVLLSLEETLAIRITATTMTAIANAMIAASRRFRCRGALSPAPPCGWVIGWPRVAG